VFCNLVINRRLVQKFYHSHTKPPEHYYWLMYIINNTYLTTFVTLIKEKTANLLLKMDKEMQNLIMKKAGFQKGATAQITPRRHILNQIYSYICVDSVSSTGRVSWSAFITALKRTSPGFTAETTTRQAALAFGSRALNG